MSAEKPAATPIFKFRFFPVLTVVLLGFGVPWLSGELVDFVRHYSHLVPPMADRLGRAYTEYSVQLVLALVAIGVMKWLAPGDYGLHAPRNKSYAWNAVAWGLVLGVAMMLVDYAPFVLTQTAPKYARELTSLGWLGFQGGYAGFVEEILFRALLVTYLTIAMPGSVRVGSLRVNGAGLVVAVIYALYAADFVGHPFELALGQMFLALAAGTLYAYWLEKSGSVLAPIIGRNVAGIVEWALLLLIVKSWA